MKKTQTPGFLQKAREEKREKEALSKDFLAALHTIQFSKGNDPLNIARRVHVIETEYARRFESEETAALVEEMGWRNYEELMDEYIATKDVSSSNLKNYNVKWADKNIDEFLDRIDPLPCQPADNRKGCKNKEITDNDVKIQVGIWRGDYVRSRKLPGSGNQEQSSKSNFNRTPAFKPPRPQDNSESFMDKPSTSDSNRSKPSSSLGRFFDTNKKSNFEDKPADSRQNSFAKPFQPSKRMDFSEGNQDKRNRFNSFSNRNKRDEDESDNGFGKNKSSRRYGSKFSSRSTDEEASGSTSRGSDFRSGRAEFHVQQAKKNPGQRTLGTAVPLRNAKSANSKFKPLFGNDEEDKTEPEVEENEILKGIDKKFIEVIKNEIQYGGKSVDWEDIAGLIKAKKAIREIVVLPMLRPDIFKGIRAAPKGILLFGPPGTGKTLIGKCIAAQSKSTFFSISASSLTSKWLGDSEKLVRALFAVAKVEQPSVIFIDEIDSILCQRTSEENECTRRIKTEFLVQLDGTGTGENDRILVVGATNRPQELDEAARRRLTKRLYIPLPDLEARKQIVENLMSQTKSILSPEEIDHIAKESEGFSGADMANLCKEASMGPIRTLSTTQLECIDPEDVGDITHEDFEEALKNVRPSVSQADLDVYLKWDEKYGSAQTQN